MLKKSHRTPGKPSFYKICDDNYLGIKAHGQKRRNHALATYRTRFLVMHSMTGQSSTAGIMLGGKWLPLPMYLLGKMIRLKLEVYKEE